jgi:hypothetical protein
MTCQGVKWFSRQTVIIQGVVCSQAVGGLCELCGLTCESYPLEEQQDVVNKCRIQATFRRGFDAARSVMQTTVIQSALFKNASVQSVDRMGISLESVRAWVSEADFTEFFGVSPKVAGENLVTMKNSDNDMISGVILKLDALPEELPYQTIRLYHKYEIVHIDDALPRGEAVRDAQGTELMSMLVANNKKERVPEMRWSGNIKTVGQVKENIAKAQKDKEEEERRQAAVAASIEDAAASGETDLVTRAQQVAEVQSSSRLKRFHPAPKPAPKPKALAPPQSKKRKNKDSTDPDDAVQASRKTAVVGGSRATVLVATTGDGSRDSAATPTKGSGSCGIDIGAIKNGQHFGRELHGVILQGLQFVAEHASHHLARSLPFQSKPMLASAGSCVQRVAHVCRSVFSSTKG